MKKYIIEIADETLRTAANDLCLTAILANIKGLKLEEKLGVRISNYGYRLGAEMRGYCISPKNWHVSVKAKELWDDITDANIHMYDYTQKADVKSDFNVLTYPGAWKSKVYTLYRSAGEVFEFNDIFIVEHTTCCAQIKQALLKVYSETATDDENKRAFKEILEKIHVTRILRNEDVKIKKASGRVTVNDVINLSSEELFRKSMENMNYPVIF